MMFRDFYVKVMKLFWYGADLREGRLYRFLKDKVTFLVRVFTTCCTGAGKMVVSFYCFFWSRPIPIDEFLFDSEFQKSF
jgi:hypothetical protein